MIDIKHHPHLHDEQILRMVQIHHAADIILSLHYSTHTNHMTAHELFEQVGKRIQKRTKIEYFLGVFLFDDKAYKLIEKDEYIKDYSPCYVAIYGSVIEFARSIETRKSEFEKKVNTWIDNNQHMHFFDIPKVEDLVHRKQSAPQPKSGRVSKPISPIKNDSSKFLFKQKNEAEQQAKTGLSILERIRLKEKESKQNKQSPEDSRISYLEGKLVPVYNIVHQLYGEHNGGFKSFPLTKVTQTVKDSLDHPMEKDEIVDTLKLMQTKLGANTIEIVTRNGLSVVKVHQLDRTKDMALL